MTFKELLNKYMDELEISSKELADKANISYPVISRYKTGERTPKLESSQLLNLASALEKFSIEKNIKHTKEEILQYIVSIEKFSNHPISKVFLEIKEEVLALTKKYPVY